MAERARDRRRAHEADNGCAAFRVAKELQADGARARSRPAPIAARKRRATSSARRCAGVAGRDGTCLRIVTA
jgi:hypothetical protein